MKTALTIAGSDSCGGAGIQADLKVFTVLGVYGMSALTAITAQNTLGVKAVHTLDAEFVAQQIDTVAGDIAVDAVKTGMLSNAAVIEAVCGALKRNALQPYVCDPVMFAKSGDALLEKDAVESMKRRLIPLATIVTPNRREAAALTGGDASSCAETIDAAKETARRLVDLGAKAAVVKGIEQGGDVVDVFFDGQEFIEFAGKAQPRGKTHGSGCAFSAAITAGLASGLALIAAVDQAKKLITTAIEHGLAKGRGTTSVNVLAFKSAEMPANTHA